LVSKLEKEADSSYAFKAMKLGYSTIKKIVKHGSILSGNGLAELL